MHLSIEEFIAKGKLSLPDVLFGLPAAHRMHFVPVMSYPGGVYVSSPRYVEDQVNPPGGEHKLPDHNSYLEERRNITIDFAYIEAQRRGNVRSAWWVSAQETGYTLLSRSTEWELFHSRAETMISAYALYLNRTGMATVDAAPVVDAFLRFRNYPNLPFVKDAALHFIGGHEKIEVAALPGVIEQLQAFCQAPSWAERGTRPYADLEKLSGSFKRFLRENVDEAVLANIDEAIATGMSTIEALERAGQALKVQAFRDGDKFDPIAAMANVYSRQAFFDADNPPSPEQILVFRAAIDRACETGLSVGKESVIVAKRRILNLRRYEQLIESKASRISDGEITFNDALQILRQVVNLERAANDNPEGDVVDELIDAATSFKVAIALARRFAQQVHEDIMSDFESSLPDVHSLLSAIRSTDFPPDLEEEVEQRITESVLKPAHG
jgi:hypothetical protein